MKFYIYKLFICLFQGRKHYMGQNGPGVIKNEVKELY